MLSPFQIDHSPKYKLEWLFLDFDIFDKISEICFFKEVEFIFI